LKATHKTNPGQRGGVSDGAWPTWQDELILWHSKKGLRINIFAGIERINQRRYIRFRRYENVL